MRDLRQTILTKISKNINKLTETGKRVEVVLRWLENLPDFVDHELKSLRIFNKGKSDIVTSLDLSLDQSFLSLITNEFPQDAVLSEESGWFNEGAEFLHVLDPIDLTRNVSRNLPFFILYSLHDAEKNFDPLIGMLVGFRPFWVCFGVREAGIFTFEENHVSEIVYSEPKERFSYAVLHNFHTVETSFPSDYQLISGRYAFFLLLKGEIDCVLFSLDEIGFQWGYYAWDFLAYISLLKIAGSYKVNFFPSGHFDIDSSGRLVVNNLYLRKILAYDKTKENEALALAKRFD
ncbi:MAG: hypothetical protein NZT61_02405 [Deltaproteobacteria bacterium]|nr:hypothetical protein [Deltaproteobacteria bacterium]